MNADGHELLGPYNRINQNGPEEMGWRTTAQNLNLNRDFMKSDAPEMQAWLTLFNQWKPDFFIDTHTTDGADYQYVITYSLETGLNTDTPLGAYLGGRLIPKMESYMKDKGFPVFPYVSFRQWHDPRSGLYSQPAPAMLSHGYAAARNRPGLLIETHMLKPYKPRVESTLEIIRFVMIQMNQDRTDLQRILNEADAFTSSPAFRAQPMPLKFSLSKTDSVMIDFAGIHYHIETSDLTGGKWHIYGKDTLTMQLPVFRQAYPESSAWLPDYYLIPPEWQTVIERLKIHGVEMSFLNSSLETEIQSYRLEDVKWRPSTFEGRHPMSFNAIPVNEKRIFPPGTAVINMNQPLARVIALLLEPESNDSFVYWGFFNAITEQKEYSETYVMEKMAREMIHKNPSLLKEFEEWKKKHPGVEKDNWTQLNWFYKKTPYYDSQHNRYPVGRGFGNPEALMN